MFELFRKDVTCVSGGQNGIIRVLCKMSAFFLVVMMFEIFVSWLGFISRDTPFGPSLHQAIGWGAFKIILFEISFLFFLFGFFLEFSILLFRYMALKFSNQSKQM
jgi:hypothetical protein